MVRLNRLFIFLPEPDEWRQNGAEALAPRALVVLEVESFDVMMLGPTRLVQLDPHGAIAERQGEAAVELLKKHKCLGGATGEPAAPEVSLEPPPHP